MQSQLESNTSPALEKLRDHLKLLIGRQVEMWSQSYWTNDWDDLEFCDSCSDIKLDEFERSPNSGLSKPMKSGGYAVLSDTPIHCASCHSPLQYTLSIQGGIDALQYFNNPESRPTALSLSNAHLMLQTIEKTEELGDCDSRTILEYSAELVLLSAHYLPLFEGSDCNLTSSSSPVLKL